MQESMPREKMLSLFIGRQMQKIRQEEVTRDQSLILLERPNQQLF